MIRLLLSISALLGAGFCLFQIERQWDIEGANLSLPPESRVARVKETVVVVDAGHGGVDGGTKGHGVLEKNITLDIARRVEKKLQACGIKVIMTRGVDVYVELEERCAIANRNRAEAFVSIHMNADATSGDTNGLETYFCSKKILGDMLKLKAALKIPAESSFKDNRSELLAVTVHQNICKGTGALDRKVRDSNYYVALHTVCPSILIECGYLTNESESSRLQQETYKETLAEAIAQGVTSFLIYAKINPRRGIVIEDVPQQLPSAPVTPTNP